VTVRRRRKDRGREDAAAIGERIAPEDVPPGPYDVDEVPDDGLARVDLGALRVPVVDGVEVRVDVDPSGQVVSATLVDGRSAVQLGVFAAPKSNGIWAEVRDEIAQSLREAGGNAREVEGDYGVELAAQVPGEGRGTSPARFVGVDGPRWFLRALVTGQAALDPPAGALLDSVFQGLVVVRGDQAMPLRDPLPLRLPKEALEAAEAAGAPTGEPGPPGRGPEISEVR
jgi:hypothetical protein